MPTPSCGHADQLLSRVRRDAPRLPNELRYIMMYLATHGLSTEDAF